MLKGTTARKSNFCLGRPHRPPAPRISPASARILGPGSRRIMPHPVRDNQATTTPPHQPSPPHPTPAGDPPGRPTSPPQQAPHPPAGCPAWAQLARRPASRAADARWVVRRSPPARPPLALATCRPQRLVCGQQGQGLFAALGCCTSAPHHPLPPCAQLTGGAWAAGGSGWRSRPPGRPAAGRVGRDLPALGPCWCLWATPAAAAFLRLFQLFVAALHWFRSVCRAHGCAGSIRRG